MIFQNKVISCEKMLFWRIVTNSGHLHTDLAELLLCTNRDR